MVAGARGKGEMLIKGCKLSIMRWLSSGDLNVQHGLMKSTKTVDLKYSQHTWEIKYVKWWGQYAWLGGIISQCIYTSEHHTAYRKHMIICQSYLSKAEKKFLIF